MATNYVKPQEPIRKIDKETGDINYFYPLVTDDQVILEDGRRLNAVLNEKVLTYLASIKDDTQLKDMFEAYILNIDYDALLAFDTSEIVSDASNTTSVLGQAILGQMVLV